MAVLHEGELSGQTIGVENHLNIIHRPSGAMTRDEAEWLAGVLRSDVVDRFRGSAVPALVRNPAADRRV